MSFLLQGTIDQRLVQTGYADLRAYLRGGYWRARRERFHAAHPLTVCFICGLGHDIELHHRTYSNVGDEPDSDLVPLCEDHHHEVERRIRSRRWRRWDAHERYRQELEERRNGRARFRASEPLDVLRSMIGSEDLRLVS